MKQRWFLTLLVFSLCFMVVVPSSFASQVVILGQRAWAKKALEQEKTLEAPVKKNTLAVLYFMNKTGQADLDVVQKGLTLMLITDLSAVKGLDVVERVKLQALTEELGLGASGLVEPDSAPRVGKLLGAYWLVGGDILKGQPLPLQIQSSLLDVPTRTIVDQPVSNGDLETLFQMEKELALEIVKQLNITLSPQEETRLRTPCSSNTKALLALFKGIDASDRGEYDQAAEYYARALKEDPGVCIANDAIQELDDLALIAAKPRLEKPKSTELLESLQKDTSLTNQLTPKEQTRRNLAPIGGTTPVDVNVDFP